VALFSEKCEKEGYFDGKKRHFRRNLKKIKKSLNFVLTFGVTKEYYY